MAIIRWQPFTELMSLRQTMDRLFDDSFVTPSRMLRVFNGDGTVPVDMYHTEKELVVKATLPGVKPEEVGITITGDTLTLKGETRADKEIKREDYFYQEHRYGAFNRSVTLPSGLNVDKADATFDDGILTLAIPKADEVKPKQIKVKNKGTVEGKK